MPEWLVSLTGRDRDLRFLATALRDPWRVTEEDGEFHLRSRLFETLDHAGEVERLAGEFVEGANLAASVRFEGYRGVLAGAVVRLDPDGSRHVTVFTAAGQVKVGGLAPLVCSGSASSPSDLVADVALLEQRPALVEALSRVRDEPNWYGYWKAFEAVRDAAGGQEGLRKKGWAAKSAITRFTRSAQPGRHHRYPAPPDPMTEADGRGFILGLLRRWIDQERSGRKR